MERYWDNFEPTLNKVRSDLKFINGFLKSKSCKEYEMNSLEHAKKFGEQLIRQTTVKHG